MYLHRKSDKGGKAGNNQAAQFRTQKAAQMEAKHEEGRILQAIRNRCEAITALSYEYKCKSTTEKDLVNDRFHKSQEYWLEMELEEFQSILDAGPPTRQKGCQPLTLEEFEGPDCLNYHDCLRWVSADLAPLYYMKSTDRRRYLLEEINKYEEGEVDKWYRIWIRQTKREKEVKHLFERMLHAYRSAGGTT